MLKIVTIVGARPQFIKAAALSRQIKENYSSKIKEVIVHTGQHYDQKMSDVFFNQLQIPTPDYNLGIGSGSHGKQTGEMMIRIEEVIEKEKPDSVVVYGDTNSTVAAALVASKMHIAVTHIEAGLRSFNKSMPEEINRIFTDHVSTLLFSPTQQGIDNLAREGLTSDETVSFSLDNPGIFLTGDVMYDNNLYFRKKAAEHSTIIEKLNLKNKRFALVTIHRPVNTDSEKRLNSIFQGLLEIAKQEQLEMVIPLHPRTSGTMEASGYEKLRNMLTPSNGIHLVPPVDYLDMISLESGSSLIITDSGGVQKEAWFMKKPLIVLRKETEWTEIIEHGNGVLVDANQELIIQAAKKYITNPPNNFPDIYGDGNASAQILDIMLGSTWK